MKRHDPSDIRIVLPCLLLAAFVLTGCSKNPPPPDTEPDGTGGEPSIHRVIVPQADEDSTGSPAPRRTRPDERRQDQPEKPNANTSGWGGGNETADQPAENMDNDAQDNAEEKPQNKPVDETGGEKPAAPAEPAPPAEPAEPAEP